MRVSAAFERHPDAAPIRAWLEDRYGLPTEVLGGFELWHRPGSPAVWMARLGVRPPPSVRVEALGLMVMRKPPPAGKPTSVFLQRVGAHARRNAVDLAEAQVEDFLGGGWVPVQAPEARGYVVVRAPVGVLGCGWLEAGGRLRSQLPGAWLYGAR